MKALVRLIKWLIIITLALAVLTVAGYFSYSLYSDAQANKPLTLRTGASDWQWQNNKSLGNRRSSDVQWRIEDDTHRLRRVYGNHTVVAWLTKNEDGAINLVTEVFWLVDCTDGTSTETSATYANGDKVSLECVEQDWGNELAASGVWGGVDVDDLPLWSDNLDGFEVDEDFGGYAWNFRPALRHLTLQSAKRTEETEQ